MAASALPSSGAEAEWVSLFNGPDLSAMLGRTAAFKQHEVTGDELFRSTETWDSKLNLTRLA